ncbi:GNAT family N-acetyltransferase [Pseudonocardia nematodicida]|uniref:GNAT family N-acetyltransferase n=1 Tax=Pseudonocardia nematodicida TaxID=1206997 RepID=A0ABV1KBG1_9PSEU
MTRGPARLEFLATRSDAAPASELFARLDALFDAQYAHLGRASRPGSVTTPEEMAPPHGAFLLGVLDGVPVAIGGLRRLDDRTCEIKRLYVEPPARSAGVGRRLLAALEDAARALGYGCARVDTGPAQRHSRALFRATGYRVIPRYNDNHVAVWFAEKDLGDRTG